MARLLRRPSAMMLLSLVVLLSAPQLDPDERYISGESVQLWSGPDKKGQVIDRLRINTPVTVVSRAAAPWIAVLLVEDDADLAEGESRLFYVHERFLASRPARLMELLAASDAAGAARATRRALVLAERAAAIGPTGRSALLHVAGNMEVLGRVDASQRIQDSVSGRVEYLARCVEQELVLMAEVQRGHIRALNHAADLPNWHKVLIRSDLEKLGWVTVDDPEPKRARLRWRIPQTEMESVSLGVLALGHACRSGDLYSTSSQLAPVGSQATEIGDLLGTVQSLRAHRGVPDELPLVSLSALAIADRPGLRSLQLGFQAPSVDVESPVVRHVWILQEGAELRAVRAIDASTPVRWFKLGGEVVVAVVLEPAEVHWEPDHLTLVTVGAKNEVEVQRVELAADRDGC